MSQEYVNILPTCKNMIFEKPTIKISNIKSLIEFNKLITYFNHHFLLFYNLLWSGLKILTISGGSSSWKPGFATAPWSPDSGKQFWSPGFCTGVAPGLSKLLESWKDLS